MSMNWNDFNDAEQQTSFDLIPKGTLTRVRMTIKPGGFDDAARGWTDGYATESFDTGSIYLAAEFVVLEGEFAKRKLWSNIGLHSPKGDAWANMGRTFIRAALNSAYGVLPSDQSPEAQNARRIGSFSALDGIEFVARIDVEKDNKGEYRNTIKQVIEPDHKDYARLMGVPPKAGQFGFSVCDGLIQGHVDGIIMAAPADLGWSFPMLWECKTMNAQNWRDCVKRGVSVAKPVYAAQMAIYQAYMESTVEGISRNPALFTAINKDTQELWFELVPFDAVLAQRASDRAVKIITATEHGELLTRSFSDSTHIECKFCSWQDRCWRSA